MHCVCESSSIEEKDLARRWWALPSRTQLPLSTGENIQLLFTGHPGSSAGPDVHDAVFSFNTVAQNNRSRLSMSIPDFPMSGNREIRKSGIDIRSANSATEQCVGDVEFHLRSSDWTAHQHHLDPRYNQVILHVVLICDDPAPTQRQDGTLVPICSLNDLPLTSPTSWLPVHQEDHPWPCQHLMPSLNEHERSRLLQQAGLLRFEQKTHAFVEQLHTGESNDAIHPSILFSPYDICLLVAMAEGLGYGRDRAFFRAIGRHLCGLDQSERCLPEPLGHSDHPAPLDAARLRVLTRLVEQCHTMSIWLTLHQILLAVPVDCLSDDKEVPELEKVWQFLHSFFMQVGLSQARSDILIVNVVLPFAAAVGLIEHDSLLGSRAEKLYIHHPGLPSNRLTRRMCQQLQLEQEPAGSCQQQGLQYIYQQTCREKHCAFCIVGRNEI